MYVVHICHWLQSMFTLHGEIFSCIQYIPCNPYKCTFYVIITNLLHNRYGLVLPLVILYSLKIIIIANIWTMLDILEYI